MEELVLVVPAALLEECGNFQGFVPFDGESVGTAYLPLLRSCNQRFIPKSEAEKDPTFKQLLPYILILNNEGHIAHYKRGKSSGEPRLHGCRSVGFGGHINSSDGVLDDGCGANYYGVGANRELNEELRFTPDNLKLSLDTLGLLYDNNTEVGKVHLGVAHCIRLPGGASISANEKGIADLRFSKVKDLYDDITFELASSGTCSFESWSTWCIAEIHQRGLQQE